MVKSNRVDAANTGQGQAECAISLLETPNENIKETPFPVILHKVISDKNTNYCIHWLPCGKRFLISDRGEFIKNMLNRYFDNRGNGKTKFTSFTRRLKRWQFKRVPSGLQMGAYYRENFLQDHPDLAEKIMYLANQPTSTSVIRNPVNSRSLQIRTDDDPLLDERFGYRSHLGQDFEHFMSHSDNGLSSSKSYCSAIDTGIDIKAVFRM